MEKRTLIAIFLTIVFLFVFQTYFSPKPAVQEPAKQNTEGTKGVVEQKSGGAPVPASEPAAKKENAPKAASPVAVVETPLLTAKLVDLGGGIGSIKLKEYKEKVQGKEDKELIEDVKPYGAIPALSKQVNGQTVDDQTPFRSDKDKLTVRDKAETVVLSGAMSDGTSVRKIYTFYPDRYTVDLKIEVDNKDQSRPVAEFAMINEHKDSSYTFRGPLVYTGKKFEQIDKLEKAMEFGKEYKYAGLDEGYFSLLWIPAEESKPSLAMQNGEHNIPLMRLALDKGVTSGKLYFGPKKTSILKTLDVGAEKIVDFGWFDIIAKPMIAGLNIANKVTHNYGIDIILLTILIKIIFYPLSVKSYKSMKEMQKMQPIIQKLKEKYKDDRQKLNAEMMGLYKTKGINPMGGCLPMVIQIPVFFALYKALSGALELRHSPFMFWINDLSAPEDLFSFAVMGYTIPIRILPLIMGVTQVIQQKMTPTTVDPMQEKMMMFMPILFTFLFWGFPSGLVLYWLVNNVISIAQQYYINKKVS
jgi:YidC/Oxa1 family membrane protein insertase